MPMFHDETQPETHLERSTPLPLQPAPPDADVQRKRMLMALGILLMALAAVVLKDWDFWFPPAGEAQEAMARTKSRSMAAATASTSTAPAREHKPAKSPTPAAAEAPFSATTERAALPPLQVEVVAGNRHINVPAKSNAIHVDVDSGATSSASNASASAASAPGSGTAVTQTQAQMKTSAADRVQLSPQTAQSVSVSVPPDYPLLARQMKVQGAVSLAGAHRARRQHPGIADSQWSGDPRHCGSRGGEAVALQALPAKRTARRNSGPHHCELHHLHKLIRGGVARTLMSAAFAVALAVALFVRLERARRDKIKRASGFFRIQDARAALPQNCSMRM